MPFPTLLPNAGSPTLQMPAGSAAVGDALRVASITGGIALLGWATPVIQDSEGNATVSGHSAFGNAADIDTINLFPSYDASIVVAIGEDYTGTPGDYVEGLDISIELNPAASAASTVFAGIDLFCQTKSSNTQPWYEITGVIGWVEHAGSGAVGTLDGVEAFAVNRGAGNVTTVIGSNCQIGATGSGNVTNGWTIFAERPAKQGAGTITNCYGLLINDHSGIGVTASYNILSKGASSYNKFEGTVEVLGTLHAHGSGLHLAPNANVEWGGSGSGTGSMVLPDAGGVKWFTEGGIFYNSRYGVGCRTKADDDFYYFATRAVNVYGSNQSYPDAVMSIDIASYTPGEGYIDFYRQSDGHAELGLDQLVGLDFAPARGIRWGSNHADSGFVLGIHMYSSGVVEINNGTPGTPRDLRARHVSLTGDLTIGGSNGVFMPNFTGFNFKNAAGNFPGYGQVFLDSTGGPYGGTDGMVFYLAGATRMSITPAGDVCLGPPGTATPGNFRCGAVQVISMADASAPINAIYFSSDASALVYKDAGGTVHALY